MQQAERLRTFERTVEDIERRCREAIVASEQQLAACAARFAALEAHYGLHARRLNARAQAGERSSALRVYQSFLATLEESMHQQAAFLTQARAARDADRLSWQHAAERAAIIARLVNRWKSAGQRFGTLYALPEQAAHGA